ncbi:MAG: oligosaccharide flippase family protein [Methylotenera sp.]|nr:oligosaccharide flippase family protein [Methylotenera sp.]
MANPMRAVLSNFWILIRGRGMAAVMAFGATALAARALGPVEFGLLILIHTYAMLIRALLDFQTGEASVRFGVTMHDTGNTNALARLIKACRLVDVKTSRIATALAVVIAPLAGFSIGLDTHHIVLLASYCLVLLTTGTGTAAGILRLHNRLDIFGKQMTIAPTIRFLGVLTAWYLGGSLQNFVLIWMLAYAAENAYIFWHAKREYKQHIQPALLDNSAEKASLDEFIGLRHFMWVAYWQSNLDVLPKHITTVSVGYILGQAEAGLLRLARELSSILNMPALMIRQVILLDLTRNWHQGNDAFDLIAYRTAMLGGVLGLIFVVISHFFGTQLLTLIFGPAYEDTAPVLTLLLLAATFELAASPLRSAAYAIGLAKKVLHLYIASTALYLVLFAVLTHKVGLIGAGIAACSTAIIPLIGMFRLIQKNKHKKPMQISKDN